MEEWTERLKNLPSELKLNEKWHVTGQTMGQYAGIGGVVGAGISLVLFRGMALRATVTSLSTGFGAGIAWEKCSADFTREAEKGDHEKK
jgi:hypothetical protein